MIVFSEKLRILNIMVDNQDALLDEKWEFLNKIQDHVPMDMIAYEYAVRAGIDPKTAAKVFEVEDTINSVKENIK